MVKDKEKVLNELQLKLLELLMNIDNEVILQDHVIELDDYEINLKFNKKTKRFLILVESE